MIVPPGFRSIHTALRLALLLAMPALVQAAPPDLTAPGVIATIDRSATYNLGATGLRGWVYLSGGAGNTHGADGTMTGESRQILVTVASSPGNAVLAVDDVILGAMAANSGTVPLFSSDARKAFGAAIGQAEMTGAGTLRVKRWRAGTITDENIAMTIMGDYAATAPYSCPKSTLILTNARNQLVSLPDSSILTNGWAGAINGLALLAGVQPGDPDYAAVQTRLQTYARAMAAAGPKDNGLPIWDWAYTGLFLAEYYLATGDANVLPGINSHTLKLAESQSINGTFGHGPSVLRPDGSGRRMNTGYGPVNAVGIVANMAIVMGKKALLAGSQAIDPEIDGAIQRGSDFFAFFVNKGPIPYGEHEPFISGHSSNGKDPMCAVLFGLQSGRAVETEYFSRITTASYNGREYGHTGQGFSYLWSAMGANMGGALAVAEHLKPVRWHLDLSRRTDGSFAYDGAEQYGGGETTGGTYLGASGYYGMNATASYILTYALPLQRLYITGKRDTPADPPPLTLDAATVAHAVAAANFKVDSPGFTNAQLITSLSDYDPVVRHYAAIELGKRASTLTSPDLTTLRSMVTGTNANGRMGSCQALGLLQDLTALPTIVQRLDKTPEPDLWVRAKAASAIRSYASATASTHRDTMLTHFTANATNPDIIVWSDPIQMSNNFLSLALFGDAIYGGGNIRDYTINASKSLLYPAVRTGLKQPDSYSRSGASRFCFDKLQLTDVQALIPDFFKVIEIECLADRMWSADSRANGIKTLSKHKISEGIPYALAMLDIPAGFEWGSETTLIAGLNALAAYGDAARWTLPTLRGYLSEWSSTSSQYTTLVNTITSIENAITAPAQAPGLAVANSQVVSTTGTKAVILTGSSPRSSVTFTNVTDPAHGTLTGTAPNLTYTPDPGYTGPDFFTFQVLDSLGASYPSAPGTVSVIVGTAGTGLKGEYFDNMDFTNLKLTRTDAQVNFDWGTGSPNAALAADTFSVRWDGLLLVPETGIYTFSTLNSDGARLYVNGAQLIDDYVDQTTNWKDGAPVHLTAGQMVDLHMSYYENTGSAVARLKWTGPSFAGANGAIIGTQWLYDGTGTVRTPYAHAQSVTTVANTPKAINLSGSGGTLTYTVLNPPTYGALTGTAPNLTYTPAANYSGSDSFTFLVNNGTSNSNPATVSISIWAGQPATFTWASAVSGNLSTAASWTPATAPAATGQPFYHLNFAPTGTYTATHDLNNGFQLNQLSFAGTTTLAGTNSFSLVANGSIPPQFSQTSANSVTVNTPLNLAAMATLGGSGGGKVTLASQISGSGGLIKNSTGTLTVSNFINTYAGGTVINAGRVEFPAPANDNPISLLGTGSITLNPGATLQVNRTSFSNAFNLNGGTVTGGNSFQSNFSGPITLNGITTFDFPTTGGFRITGNITGTGGFNWNGSPTREFLFSGSNTHTGPTSILSGILNFTQANSVPPGPLLVNTGGKAKLNFTGNKVIASLTLDGTPMPTGSYGSTTSPATNKNDTYFSGTGMVTILPSTTIALDLTTGSTPSDPGAAMTFTATVTGTSPTGSVRFYDGSTLLGTSTLNGSFQAVFTTSSLVIGQHAITAQYVGNANNASSTSAALPVEIISLLPPAPANLTAAPGNNRVGLTWTLSPGASSYYVKRSLTNGGPYTVIGNPTAASYDDLAAVNGTTCYYVVSALNLAGESANSNQASGVPGPQPSGTTLASSPIETGTYGTPVTLTATVTASGGTATGTVTFMDGATVLGTDTLDGAGQAVFTTSALAVTSHSITATYEGDTNFLGSVSAPLAYLVTPIPLTVTGVTASDKIYDGNASAVLTSGTVSGAVTSGETVTVIPGSGTFASANAGTWAVTATGYSLGGTHAGNYVLAAQPTVPNASITPRPVHLSGTRIYDGTSTAAGLVVSNRVSGDDLTLSGTATLASKDVGTQGVVVNYATPLRVRSAKGNTGSNAATTIGVTMGAAPAAGNTMIAVIGTRGTSANIVSSINQTGVPNGTWVRAAQSNNTSMTTEIWYAPNIPLGAGTAITINQASFHSAAVVMEYSGVLAASPLDQIAPENSVGTSTDAVTGTIPATTQANELWIGGIGFAHSTRTLGTILNSFATVDNATSTNTTRTNNARVYALERTVNSTGSASSGGTINFSLQWAGTIATFKAAPSSSLALAGTAAGNYTLTGLTGSVEITPKALTLTTTPAVTTKTYDSLADATLTGSALRAAEAPGSGTTSDGTPYIGDAVTVTLSGTFDTKDAGSGKAVTSTSTIGGANAGNYTLTQPAGLTGAIAPKALTLTSTPAVTPKNYDALTAADLTGATLRAAETPGSGTTSDGIPYTGDAVTVTLIGTFDTKDAGSGKAVTSTSTLGGANAGNYTLTQPAGLTGTIIPAALTITADNQSKTYGQTVVFGSGGTWFASNGLQNGETIGTVSLTCAGGDGAAAVAGSPYTITPGAATGGTFSALNYDINYLAGTLTVEKAGQSITFGPLADRTYGDGPLPLTATSDSGLPVGYVSSDATVASVEGNIVTLLKAGSTTITASQPGDTNHHAAVPVLQTLTVDQATPAITTPPSATEITDGQTLATSILSGGAASVPGTFAFTTPATVPPVGTASHSVTFTPTDTVNYQTATTSVNVTVNPALTGFESWAADPAQGLAAGVNDGPLDDPDRDGFSNLLEFALGGAPMVSSQVIQPKLTQTGGNWVFSYQRSHLSKTTTTQVVEYGSDLTGWTPLTIPEESAGPVSIVHDVSSDRVEVSVPPLGVNGFVRLKVSQ